MKNHFYVYGVSRIKELADENFQCVSVDDLSAITEIVSAADFGEEELKQNITDISWVTEHATKHQDLLSQIINQAEVLPFSFGTVFKSKEAIQKMLSANAEAFNSKLKALTGKKEWGLKLFYLADQLKAKLIEAAATNETALTPGQLFLQKKQAEQNVKPLIKEALNDQRSKLLSSLKALKLELKILENTKQELSSEEGINILNIAMLINDDEKELVAPVVAAINANHVDRSIYTTLTGPWPAYNFA